MIFRQLHELLTVALLLRWQPQKLNQEVIERGGATRCFSWGSRADSGFNHCAIVGGVFGIQYAFYLKLFKQIFSKFTPFIQVELQNKKIPRKAEFLSIMN